MAKKRRYWKKVAITLVCGILCGGLASGGIAGYSYYKEKREEQKALQTDAETDTKPFTGELVPVASEGETEGRVSSVYDVSVVWDNVLPAMVEIDTKIVTSYEFFGRTYEEESEGGGTGIIIAQGEELFLVTNHHVVEGARAIQVTFCDGTTARAEVKGSNAGDDIAVLSVAFSELSEETL
ncbi:MAG: serine protease [Lachnospiraceae bacterium]|nr:serine protease [Lachnospiraceae bacterium]